MSDRPHLRRLAGPFDPGDSEKVAIVVVNWNGRPFLQRALESIVRHTVDEEYELIVVDNGSEDDSLEYLATFEAPGASRLEILRNDRNRYFSAAFNQGFDAASPDARYLMVFCNDVEAKERGWLGDFIDVLRSTGAAAAGHASRQPLEAEHRTLLLENFPDYRDADLAERVRSAATNPDTIYWHLSGYCFLLDREQLLRTGPYLEGGPFRQYHSDWELYLRMHAAGLQVASFMHRVHHWHGVSELIAEHPQRYAELVTSLGNPRTLRRYLRRGRPLFEEESAYAAWRAQRDGRGET